MAQRMKRPWIRQPKAFRFGAEDCGAAEIASCHHPGTIHIGTTKRASSCPRSLMASCSSISSTIELALAVMHDHWKHGGKPARLSERHLRRGPVRHGRRHDSPARPGELAGRYRRHVPPAGRAWALAGVRPPRCGAASLPQLSSWCMLTRVDDADRELRHRFETAYGTAADRSRGTNPSTNRKRSRLRKLLPMPASDFGCVRPIARRNWRTSATHRTRIARAELFLRKRAVVSRRCRTVDDASARSWVRYSA
jgi:hypothetical protein